MSLEPVLQSEVRQKEKIKYGVLIHIQGFPGGASVKNLPVNAPNIRDSIPGLERSPEGGHHNPLLPGKFHGQRSLVGYNP